MPSLQAEPPEHENAPTACDRWWRLASRLVVVQLCCSMLMQLSYVAFPAYNFALALWCAVCCTPHWSKSNPRLMPLCMAAVGVSVVTDIVWMSLWVSGRVFYDQICGSNGVSIVSCGGGTDFYPGCQTNRFALLMLIANDVAKIVTTIAMHRIHALTPPKSQANHHHHTHHHPHDSKSHHSSSSSNPAAVVVPRLDLPMRTDPSSEV